MNKFFYETCCAVCDKRTREEISMEAWLNTLDTTFATYSREYPASSNPTVDGNVNNVLYEFDRLHICDGCNISDMPKLTREFFAGDD
jgi:hypothetical protein